MTERKITRRQFMQQSAAGGLANLASPAKTVSGPAKASSQPAAGLALRVLGDSQSGYNVTLLWRGLPVTRDDGEFSALFQNGDRSLEDPVESWKASSWTGDAHAVTLLGKCRLPHLSRNNQSPPTTATVDAEVTYEVMTPHVVRKRMRLRQSDLYMLFYQVSHRLEPESAPAKFWSFDQANCRGGPLHEYFPAAGFRTAGGLTVGLLTGSGYDNGWSRIIRRDGEPVKPAPRRIPDAWLCSVSLPEERARGDLFVQQNFGEELVRSDDGQGERVNLPPVSSWKTLGQAGVKETGTVIVLSGHGAADGVLIPFPARGGEVYSLRLQYRAAQPFAVELWDVDSQLHKIADISLYNDQVPESPAHWGMFRTTVFFYSRRGSSGALFIGAPSSQQGLSLGVSGGGGAVEIAALEVRRLPTHREPYHCLEMDNPVCKTAFIFADEHVADTLRGYRLASQIHLADALGFHGGETEKVLYADLQMLSWSAAPHYAHPMIAPSIWYSAAGEMYLRDSFFAANGVPDRALNEGVFNLWAANQGADGAINTLVEPNRANLERKSNDSTPLWLMWALQNRRRFGTTLPMDKVRKAAEYCLNTYDRHHNGACWAQFVMGQLDVIDYPQGTSDLCENQGMLAVTLRAIRELGVPGVSERISADYLAEVEEGYRSYYDRERKFMRPARGITDAIGFGEIFPEFLSLWLFQRKILSDDMMVNHLDRIPVMMPRDDAPHPAAGGTVRPIFIGLTSGGKGWGYFTDTWHPMISAANAAGYANHQMDGIYYNGGSWMRIEVCGYVAGKLHGWERADQAIANRLWAEVHIAPDFPTSQEYLATDPAHPFFGYHRVFAWNAFVLQALELAGLRKPA